MHSLRHCYATHLLEQRVSLRQVQLILGHKSTVTTERYTHLTKIIELDSQQAINQLVTNLKLSKKGDRHDD